MPPFKIVSDFGPTGDQPQAVDRLVEGLERGYRHQTLLGVTGSGKTFTMANVIVQSIHADLVNEGKMERVEPGEYRLIGAQPSLLK